MFTSQEFITSAAINFNLKILFAIVSGAAADGFMAQSGRPEILISKQNAFVQALWLIKKRKMTNQKSTT